MDSRFTTTDAADQGPVVVKTQVWRWLLLPSATTTDSERRSRTPEAQSHLISISAKGKPHPAAKKDTSRLTK
ncbi:hypothetical protein V8E54_010245 [Elaphomyces granulatus]